jgi:hypothetical protein
VVVAGPAAVVADRADDRQVVRLPTQVRQVFAELDAGRARRDGAERAAVLGRGVGLHVPGVDVRRPAAEPDQDGRLRYTAANRRLGYPGTGQVDAEEAEPAGDQERSPIERVMTAARESHHRPLASVRQRSSMQVYRTAGDGVITIPRL